MFPAIGIIQEDRYYFVPGEQVFPGDFNPVGTTGLFRFKNQFKMFAQRGDIMLNGLFLHFVIHASVALNNSGSHGNNAVLLLFSDK
jgi:hypothetical protein